MIQRPRSIFFMVGAATVVVSYLLTDAAQPWESQMIRLTGMLLVALGANWEWARAHSSDVHLVQRRWTAGGVAAGLSYVVGGASPFLVVAFCLCAGGVLTTWVERAHLAADSLADSLGAR